MTGKQMEGSVERLWTKDFILVIVMNFILFFGFQMLLPTLPMYVQDLGGGETMAGLILGIFTVSAVLIRPFAGKMLDSSGRKIVLVTGLIIFLLAVLGYNWAPSLIILLVLRFIHGFGWGAASTATGTVASDLIPKSRLGEGMGFFGLAGTLAMAVAPLAGLTIIANYNFTTLFFLSAALVVISLLLINFISFIEITKTPKEANVKVSLFEKSAFRPSLVMFFITMTYGSVVAFIALYAGQQGIENVGLFFTVYAVTLTIIRPIAGRFADKRGLEVIIIPGMIFITLAMGLLSFADNLTLFLLAGVVYGLGFGTVQPSLQAMVIKDSPPDRRGAANGTFFSAFDLGIGAGSILWGAVAQAVGYSQMYLWAMTPAIIGMIVYHFYGRKTEREV